MKGGYADERHERAASLMPDAHIRFTEITYQRNDLQKSLILGDDSFDIFCFDAQDVNTKNLMERATRCRLRVKSSTSTWRACIPGLRRRLRVQSAQT